MYHNIVVLFILFICCTQHMRVLIFILGRADVILDGVIHYLIRRPFGWGEVD